MNSPSAILINRNQERTMIGRRGALVAVAVAVAAITASHWPIGDALDQSRAQVAAQPLPQQTSPPRVVSLDVEAVARTPTHSSPLVSDRPVSAVKPAVHNTDASGNSVPTAIAVPPGTNFIEAVKLLEEEQARKQSPGSAGVNPFGS